MASISELTDYIRDASMRDWAWGEHDCTSWLAPWVEARAGRPVGVDARMEARQWRRVPRLLAKHGGLVGLVEDILKGVAERVSEPADGDLGVLTIVELMPGARNARQLQVGAIRHMGRWVLVTAAGCAALDQKADAIWRLH